MGALEQRIQNSILRYLRRQPETWAFKADVSTRGIPDVICVHCGRFVVFEVKQPGKKPTADQINFLTVMRGAGAFAGVAHDPGEALDIVGGRCGNG